MTKTSKYPPAPAGHPIEIREDGEENRVELCDAIERKWDVPSQNGHPSNFYNARDLYIGEWWVRPAEGLLMRDGEEIHLRPRAMEVLALLATRPGHAVSKEEIFATVWAGSAVEDGALAHCISEIRNALGDMARNPRYIETLSKRGYRLVAETTRDAPGPAAPSHAPPAPSHRPRRLRGFAVAGLFTALAVAGLPAWLPSPDLDRSRTGPPRSAAAIDRRPKVAVLGFSNLSGDRHAHWLSTALVEMLTTELAVSKVVQPIPRDAVARIKREFAIADSERLRAETLRQLRAGLGVDFVVVGSYFTPAGGESDELRVDLRLQDIRSGEIVAAAVETGTVSELADLVLLAGLRLRRALGDEEQLANQRSLSSDRLPPASTRVWQLNAPRGTSR